MWWLTQNEVKECFALFEEAYGWSMVTQEHQTAPEFDVYYSCGAFARRSVVAFRSSGRLSGVLALASSPDQARREWLSIASGNTTYCGISVPRFSSAAELRLKLAAEGRLR